MNDILITADTTATNSLLSAALRGVGSMTANGRTALDVLEVGWCSSASITGGSVDLRTPDIMRVKNLTLEFTIGLNTTIPVGGKQLEIRRACHSGRVGFSHDFSIQSNLCGSDWCVQLETINTPEVQLGAVAERMKTSLDAVISRFATAEFPRNSEHIAAACAQVSIPGITSLLEGILTRFLSDLCIPIFSQPRMQSVVPICDTSGQIRFDDLTANIVASRGGELVLSADIQHIQG